MKKLLLFGLLCSMPILAMEEDQGEPRTIAAFCSVGNGSAWVSPNATDGEINFMALVFGKEGKKQQLADELKALRDHTQVKPSEVRQQRENCNRYIASGLCAAAALAFVGFGLWG